MLSPSLQWKTLPRTTTLKPWESPPVQGNTVRCWCVYQPTGVAALKKQIHWNREEREGKGESVDKSSSTRGEVSHFWSWRSRRHSAFTRNFASPMSTVGLESKCQNFFRWKIELSTMATKNVSLSPSHERRVNERKTQGDLSASLEGLWKCRRGETENNEEISYELWHWIWHLQCKVYSNGGTIVWLTISYRIIAESCLYYYKSIL